MSACCIAHDMTSDLLQGLRENGFQCLNDCYEGISALVADLTKAKLNFHLFQKDFTSHFILEALVPTIQ